MNLFEKMIAVAKEVTYVRKDVESGSGSAKGVARDAVVAKLRPKMLEAGIYCSTSQIDGRCIPTDAKSSKGTPLTIYEGMYETTFINAEAPTERHSVRSTAHGNDYGDKAPGKAKTYAEKTNLISAFELETGINEEGRYPNEGDSGAPDTPVMDAAEVKDACDAIALAGTKAEVEKLYKAARAKAKEVGDASAGMLINETAQKRLGVLKEAAKPKDAP